MGHGCQTRSLEPKMGAMGHLFLHWPLATQKLVKEKHLHDLLLEGRGNAKKNQSIRENNLNKCSDMLLLEIWKKHAMASNNLSSTGLVGQ